MRIRDIETVEELREYIGKKSLSELYDTVVAENKIYEDLYYSLYRDMTLSSYAVDQGKIRSIIYKNWKYFRRIIRIYHKLRNTENEPLFYCEKVFLTFFLKERYPVVGRKDAREFYEFVADIYYNMDYYDELNNQLMDQQSRDVLGAGFWEKDREKDDIWNVISEKLQVK